MRHSLHLKTSALRRIGLLAKSFGKWVRMPSQTLRKHTHKVALTPRSLCQYFRNNSSPNKSYTLFHLT